nr:hypothetical protein [Tanacetum cinerariifolium]
MDSLVIGNEDLNTIPKKESDEVIKSSVEDLVSIRWKSVTFSNPLFDSNDDFTSSDGESLFNEDVLEDNVKIYSNPLFEFDDEYISSEVNPLFDEVLEKIDNNDSYDSNLDELALLVTPLFDSNKNECFDSRGDIDEIDAFLDADVSMDIEDGYHDSEEDIIYLIVCLLMTLFLISLLSFGVNVVEDFKEYTQRDYYCWLKTYNCWYKLKLLDNAAGRKLRLLEESVVADEKMKR